jgi:peptide alpha-N-acetyltransferase
VCRDPDPEGRQLAAVADPLAEASKLLRRLREHAGDKLLVQQLSFEVYLRQGKLLLAVHAAKAAQQVAGAADPSVHSMVVRLAAAVVGAAAAAAAAASPEAAVPAVVLEVAQQETAGLLGGSEASAAAAAAYQHQWAAQHAGSSLRHAVAAAETAAPEARAAAVQQLLAVGPAGASHATCAEVLELLSTKLQLPDAAATWQQQCAAQFRWSAVFGGADRVEVAAPWEEEAAAGKSKEDEDDDAAANGLADKTAALAL